MTGPRWTRAASSSTCAPGRDGRGGSPASWTPDSAHASSSFAAARAYARLVPGAPLYAIATAMALSRVYLGVHYPSDIAAGALLGTLVGGSGARG